MRSIQAVLEDDVSQALRDLKLLAGTRLDYIATLQIDRLAQNVFKAGPESWPEIRLALLGTSTLDHLIAPIRVAGARRGLKVTPFIGGFGMFRQELIEPDNDLRRFGPHVVLFDLRANDVVEKLSINSSDSAVDLAITAAVEDLIGLWRLARTQFGATVIQQTFLNTGYPVFGDFDGSVAASPRSIVDRLNMAVRKAAADEDVILLDIAYWSAAQGLAIWFDQARWHHAKQLIAPSAAVFYGDLVGRLLGAIRGLSSKCLVLDLDNTLWGGVIGDDGLDGIVLGQGSGTGEAFVAFQAYAKTLSQRGVILAVCSKNTREIAESAFLEHPEMVLKRDDISAFIANWNDKPSNLREIARMLNIGLDSLVFFDDNPAEREIVRQILPEVSVPEAPEDSAYYIACLAEAGYFEAIAFTEEDRNRVAQYQANTERNKSKHEGRDVKSFLNSLDMKMIAENFNAIDLPRITQLTNKSNQFNLTTRRYTQEDLAAFADSDTAITLSFRLIDKFGDNGLIGVLIALSDVHNRGVLHIDTWLMSCRVLGREVEKEVINQLLNIAAARGYESVIGTYIPTAKNGLVQSLYEQMGFTQIDDDAHANKRWSLSVKTFKPHPTSISVDARYNLQVTE